jgi:hypothetical protein
VTILRSSRVAAAVSRDAPQAEQKRASSAFSRLQLEQTSMREAYGRRARESPKHDNAPMELPETRDARGGDVSIAYQVLGDGPFDPANAG